VERRATQIPDGFFDGLEYRCVGPTRGGRVTAVAGVAQRMGTFFMGATGGGVWKTEDYGQSWRNVSDGFFASPSIGAIRVAAGDPDLVWVGTGSDGLRSNVIPGKGVYKSTDGGSTWECMGLEKTGHIGAVEIHPADPDVVLVAAIGNAFAPNEERGVYRTRDGGATWERVFHISPTCGAVDVEFHPANPDVIYASMWEAERKPWTIVSGGEQGGVWRSQDGGTSWHQLRGGLPSGVVGKSDLAVSFAAPDRLYVLMEALDGGGLYRSDDGGESFELVSQQRGLLDRPFYYCNIDANPRDADHVFVSATSYWESTNGGESFRRRSTPHGDNHEVWIHPDRPEVMIQCNDGGANVTHDGGETWSTQSNQPTAELYQVAVDDRTPYWLYAGQQDNSTIRVPSNPPYPNIGGATAFWEAVGGCETGPVVPKPGSPHIVYANCKGRFGVYNSRTGQEQQYYVGAANMYGHNPRDLAYRFQRVAPITVSPHDPDTVYHGSQFLHRTRDGGITWEQISPDLTAFEADKQVISGSPITRDITGEEFYSTLYEIAESPIEPGVLWVGANDGPIHVSRDGGETWTNVTPQDLGPGGRVQTIEPSAFEVGTAYACILRYQLGDPRPHVYRTEDFGATWTRIVEGLPEDAPCRVIREDPGHSAVLYLGTEWGMFVSVDRGVSWHPFQQNLPVTPITDMVVHEGDLVVSTMGRSFWILDDISAVTVMGDIDLAESPLVFCAPEQIRRRGGRGGRGVPEWSPAGMTIHFALPSDQERVALEIATDEGEVVRSFESSGPGQTTERGQGMRAPFSRQRGTARLPSTAGVHRIQWDFRDTSGTAGLLALPGSYKARLRVDGDIVSEAPFTLTMDPELTAAGVTVKDLVAQRELMAAVAEARGRARELVRRLDALERGDLDEVRARDLAAVRARLVTSRGTYQQPMAVDQLGYLGSMIGRADQRPGRDAYERLEQLVAILDDCERVLDGGK